VGPKEILDMPIVIMMMVFGGLLLLTTSAVAPFVYTLF
jgi:hypothetical protein